MKLMVIHENGDDEERLSDQLVPKYLSIQILVQIQMSDLRANDKPHPELFAISKKSVAPDPTGGTMTSYWFYEKSRGAWNETRNLETNTQSQRKAFDAKYPRNQRFDKGLFSKVWYSQLNKPHIVSLGPQKCFARFHTDFLTNLVLRRVKLNGQYSLRKQLEYYYFGRALKKKLSVEYEKVFTRVLRKILLLIQFHYFLIKPNKK